jgi:hypothetical protein
MDKWNRNGEGYADRTAGIAIRRVLREERKAAMAKKRSCRRTADENIIHEKAVKMRKMTDEQLVKYVEGRVEEARAECINQGKGQKGSPPQLSAVEFVEEIGRIKGIGTATMCKIRGLLDKRLEGDMDG